jgi:ethanolamine utilization protein EutN
MQLARIVGQAVATVKHASMKGWRLLVAQPLRGDGSADGEPQLVIDGLGGAKNSPVRWFVMGLCDE